MTIERVCMLVETVLYAAGSVLMVLALRDQWKKYRARRKLRP